MNNKENFFDSFFSSYSYELKSQMKRLDTLIGRDHWLSVGNYKESILRKLIRNTIPKKFEVSTGFILASDEQGNPIKSKQIDIIIWDSHEFSPVFQDEEFVIVPPEACRAVVEVKSTFNRKSMLKALSSLDTILEFVRTPLLQNCQIKKYAFFFDKKSDCFPDDIFDCLIEFYSDISDFPLQVRVDCTKSRWPQDRSWQLFSIDGIFVLGEGMVLRRVRGFNQRDVKFMFEAYKTAGKNLDLDHTYSVFEHEIQRSINNNYSPGLYYTKQPGLQSIINNISIAKLLRDAVMIFPAISEKDLYNDIPKESVYKLK